MEKKKPQTGQAVPASMGSQALAIVGRAMAESTPAKLGLLKDLLSLRYRDIITIIGLAKRAITGAPLDDNQYGIERLIEVMYWMNAIYFFMSNLSSWYRCVLQHLLSD